MKKVLITGSSGLIGSEAVIFFLKKNFKVFGVDNDLRSKLFGNYSLPHYKPLGNILDGTFERLNEPVICWEKFRCSACDYQRVGKHWRKMDDGFDKQLPICG